jgi:hypothetical protein
VLSVVVGSVPIAPQAAFSALLHPGASDDPVATILWRIRLPRTLLAGIVGGCLALAWLGFQAISRNPLADPSVLGVSSGASFGVTIAMLLGIAGPTANPVLLMGFAFAGALLAAVSVYCVARVDGRLPMTTLLLSGVIIGLFFTSCVMLITVLLAAAELQGVVMWLMGNLGPTNGETLAVLAVVAVTGALILARQAAPLNLLALGEELLSPFFLKGRADPDGRPLPVEDSAERPFAPPTVDVGEILKVHTAFKENAVYLVLGHQLPGSFAEYTLSKAKFTYRLPNTIAFEKAALIQPLAISIHAADRAGIRSP